MPAQGWHVNPHLSAARSDAFALPLGQVEASAAMEDAIEERFPGVVLKVFADFLVD